MEKENPSIDFKFGYLPRIHKDKFTENTNRYVLRRGFPDFPNCPFGGKFSMLGYDTKQKRYVWLSKSIIKDIDLNVMQYECSSMIH